MVKLLQKTALYKYLVLKLIPKIRLSTGYTKLSGEKYERIRANLKNGDMLFMYDSKKLSTYLIPDEWTHVGIYFNGYIYEMLTSGIAKTLLYDFCKQADNVSLGRATCFDQDYIDDMYFIAEDLYKKKIQYDEAFDDKSELYCSELIIYLDKDSRLRVKYEKRFGVTYISPSSLYNSFDIERIV